MRWLALALLVGCGGPAFSLEQPSPDAQLLEQPDASSSTTWDACPCPSSDRQTPGDGSSADVVDELLEHDTSLSPDSKTLGADAAADVVDELLEHWPDAAADVVVPPLQCVSAVGPCSGPWPYTCPNGECCNRPSCL